MEVLENIQTADLSEPPIQPSCDVSLQPASKVQKRNGGCKKWMERVNNKLMKKNTR